MKTLYDWGGNIWLRRKRIMVSNKWRGSQANGEANISIQFGKSGNLIVEKMLKYWQIERLGCFIVLTKSIEEFKETIEGNRLARRTMEY